MSEEVSSIVENIITEIDSKTLLGAAWDCMSDSAKERFREKLAKIIISKSPKGE